VKALIEDFSIDSLINFAELIEIVGFLNLPEQEFSHTRDFSNLVNSLQFRSGGFHVVAPSLRDPISHHLSNSFLGEINYTNES